MSRTSASRSERLGALADTLGLGLFALDERGRVALWSAGAERLTGLSAVEVEGEPCEELDLPGEDGLGALWRALSRAPGGRADAFCRLRGEEAGGRGLYAELRALPEGGAAGSFSDLSCLAPGAPEVASARSPERVRGSFQRMVGESPAMQEVFHRITLAARIDVTVLITGESGTGKELAAAAIHALSARRDKPFLGLNCSAIPEPLLESELFGHVKGAFTGAIRDKAGIFQAAEGGTLFLDEVGDLGKHMQVKLLRVLQEREIRRVGDDKVSKVDTRLISATHRELSALLASGELREDFYYRIRVFEIHMPALRERLEDLPLLVEHFVAELASQHGQEVSGLSPDALALLQGYHWPGNVRELRNAIEHAFVTVQGPWITPEDLPPHLSDSLLRVGAQGADEVERERARIEDALRRAGGRKGEAARALGISRVTLWKKLRRHGLD